MKQLEHIYVTAKQFQYKQSKKGAKFMHKIHKIAIIIRHIMRHSDALYKAKSWTCMNW